jgi:predicted metal-dependent hydrolase
MAVRYAADTPAINVQFIRFNGRAFMGSAAAHTATMTTTGNGKAEAVKIKPRNRSHNIAHALQGEWLNNDPFLTAFFNAMSITFPVGEKYFIDSVRRVAGRVTDPTLQAQIKGFCGQEGFHRREHQLYNEALCAARGYDLAKMERTLTNRLGWAQNNLSSIKNLAVTVAVEHFTAVLAELLLRPGSIMDKAEPSMRDLWRWHAAEEMEHKSVAFDVYRAAGGTEKLRKAVMRRVVVLLCIELARVLLTILRKDGRLSSLSMWRNGLAALFGKQGAFSGGLAPFREFFVEGFHPWQQDTRELLVQWATEPQALGNVA